MQNEPKKLILATYLDIFMDYLAIVVIVRQRPEARFGNFPSCQSRKVHGAQMAWLCSAVPRRTYVLTSIIVCVFSSPPLIH